MNKSVQVFKNELFEVAARENGVNVELDAESVAIGLGWSREVNGKQYIRWDRVNKHLADFSYPQVGKGEYIPESYVYLLCMKAENDIAVAFQKFIAFDVLPQIRKNKVYIDPSATDGEIDAAVRFATPQKRRTAIMDATIDGKDSIFNVYEDIKEYIKRWTADEKVTAYKHIERVLLDKQDTYGKDVAFIHKVEELLRQVAKELDKVKNWKNGAEKRVLSKKINELTPPDLEDYYLIDYAPFTSNYIYEYNERIGKWVKTKAFKKWIENFPYEDLPYDPGIDWNKPIKMYLAFVHKKGVDVQNLIKATIDLIFKHYGYDDSKIEDVDFRAIRMGTVNSHKDGKIYFMLRNV
ncbi:hypothetical protein [Paenibacillus spongiae]|uniref:Bro-N domain-containing protein n=1 Tax=Paenibacillus spongiae TaxID=2909671 RepID=A0ABY5SF14_9BACL|nr:hypothetical protein [Paenibacillus spongiae]UVI32075.1 hypothetical protein L1F29_09760 [Paenibacillus spongiae]